MFPFFAVSFPLPHLNAFFVCVYLRIKLQARAFPCICSLHPLLLLLSARLSPAQLSTFYLSPFLHVASPAAFVIFLPLFLSARESCESISVYLASALFGSPLP